jgi:hypothetical protein
VYVLYILEIRIYNCDGHRWNSYIMLVHTAGNCDINIGDPIFVLY